MSTHDCGKLRSLSREEKRVHRELPFVQEREGNRHMFYLLRFSKGNSGRVR